MIRRVIDSYCTSFCLGTGGIVTKFRTHALEFPGEGTEQFEFPREAGGAAATALM